MSFVEKIDLDNIINTSLKQYNSNFSSQINSKLFNVNSLIVQNNNIDKNIFNPLHQNINKLLNSIIDSLNDDKSLKLQSYKIEIIKTMHPKMSRKYYLHCYNFE